MPTVELRFAALPAHVRTARLVAASLARRAGVDEDVIDEVKLAVGEACARAVSLHQWAPSAGDVYVALSDDDKRFVVAVRDSAPAESDSALAVRDPLAELTGYVDLDAMPGDTAAPLPFGLAIVAGLVDDLDVSPADPGTVVRMAWDTTP
jgi:anti-sigma regulatory factor (Ser/Thr protein kinase)